jgi:hypothetical protein
MKAKIEVEPTGGSGEFRVRVTEGGSESSHRVSVKAEDYERLTGKKVPEAELVRHAFEFLLSREPKESILREFDLMAIARYFGEFEAETKRWAAARE